MADFTPPVARAASTGNLLAQTLDTLRAFVRDELDDCLPCRVEAVTETGTVNVQILPLMILSDGTTMARTPLLDIPVQWPGCQTALIRFKLQPGCLGLLKATDRDITLILQQMAEARPNTLRRHSFSDAFFIPADFREFTEAGAGDVVIQMRDGVNHISMGADNITLATGDSTFVLADGDLTATVGGSVATLSGSELAVTIGSSELSLSPSSLSVTINGVALEYTGTALMIGAIDIGPLHTHTTTSPGNPTSPVLP